MRVNGDILILTISNFCTCAETEYLTNS